jgi:hypothetical protein
MGVTVRGKGKPWWVFVAHNGKRKSLKVGAKDAAQNGAKAIQEEIANKKFNIEKEQEPGKIHTFKEYSEKWVNEYVKNTLSDATYEECEQVLRTHILPSLNHDKTLDDINRGDIKSLLISK